MRVLVTGGTRSGKSAHAEGLLADRDSVTYLATGPAPDQDADWAARVARHRSRRPQHWRTVESTEVVIPPGAVLLDSLGTWVAAQLDELDAWSGATDGFRVRAERAVAAIAEARDLVVVTEEVGLGGLAAHPAARLFADLLGELNQQVAAVCDQVHLVVAGRVLVL